LKLTSANIFKYTEVYIS